MITGNNENDGPEDLDELAGVVLQVTDDAADSRRHHDVPLPRAARYRRHHDLQSLERDVCLPAALRHLRHHVLLHDQRLLL